MAKRSYRALQDLTCKTTAIGLPGMVHMRAGEIRELDDAVAELIRRGSPESPAIELVEGEESPSAKAKRPRKVKE